jgi:hypothetical protein
LARDLNDKFAAQRLGLLDNSRRRLRRIEYHLRDAIPIAQIDKQPAAVIAVAINPAANSHFFASIFAAQLPAGVCSQQL